MQLCNSNSWSKHGQKQSAVCTIIFLFWPENDSICAHLFIWTKFIFYCNHHVYMEQFICIMNKNYLLETPGTYLLSKWGPAHNIFIILCSACDSLQFQLRMRQNWFLTFFTTNCKSYAFSRLSCWIKVTLVGLKGAMLGLLDIIQNRG